MIEDYQFGRIKINGKIYTSDVIIKIDSVNSSWWRKDGHNLCLKDLDSILGENPEVLIIGTGAYGAMKVPTDIQEKIRSLGIDLIVRQTKEACQEYNKLINNKKIIAALHLTC